MKGDPHVSMRFARSAKVDIGEAWFYLSPGKMELHVADKIGMASSHTVTITKRQLERALSAMKSGGSR